MERWQRPVYRDLLLKAIRQHFSQGNMLPLVLTGPPGVGKTQLAKQYAYNAFKDYDIIWWWEGNSPHAPQLHAFVEDLNTLLQEEERLVPENLAPEKLWRAVQQTLVRKGYTCLFIFDNAEEELQQLSSYMPNTDSQKALHILLTSCSKMTSLPILFVSPFSRAESLTFLHRILPDTSEKEQAYLAEVVSDHPLALTLAAGWIRFTPGGSVQRWIGRQAFAPQLSVFTDRYSYTMDTMVKRTLQSLQSTAPEATEGLQFLSLLHTSQIPLSWILAWCKGVQEKADACLRTLYEQSLVDCQKADNKKTTLSIHPLLHKAFYDNLTDAEKQKLLHQAIPVVATAFKGSASEMTTYLLHNPHVFPHAQRLSACAQEQHFHSLPLLSLRVRMLHYLHSGLRDFVQAQKLLALIEADQEYLSQLALEDSILYETEVSFLAMVCEMESEKALFHGKRALQLLERCPERQADKIRVYGQYAAGLYPHRTKREGRTSFRRTPSSLQSLHRPDAPYGIHPRPS